MKTALKNAAGSGTKNVGMPSGRTSNQKKGSAKMRVAPSNKNKDAGDIKKSKDFNGLMTRLNQGKPQ